jgi:hypothetical protein
MPGDITSQMGIKAKQKGHEVDAAEGSGEQNVIDKMLFTGSLTTR